MPESQVASEGLFAQVQMAIDDCGEYLKLLQNVTRVSKTQVAALARLEEAVQKDADDEEIVHLKQLAARQAVERQEAVDRYRIHLLSHESKSLGAGGKLNSATLVRMDCPECIRLEAERALRHFEYTTAVSRMNAMAGASDDNWEYTRLRVRAMEAEIDLKLVEAEIRQHRDRHAVPN